MSPDKTLDIKKLQDDLLKSPQVKTWLTNFKPPFLLNQKLTRQVEFTRASTEIHGANIGDSSPHGQANLRIMGTPV